MARKSKSARKAPATTTPRGTSDRDKAIDALMALLSEHSFERIGLAEVAGKAGIKFSQLRAEFGSTLAILAAHIKDIDRAVLAGGDADMAEEPARERLFDVLMRRLEALAPYKGAVRSIMCSVRRNPGSRLRAQCYGGAIATLDVGSCRNPCLRSARCVARSRCRSHVRTRVVGMDR